MLISGTEISNIFPLVDLLNINCSLLQIETINIITTITPPKNTKTSI